MVIKRYHLFFFTLIRGPFFCAVGSNVSSSSSEPISFDISQNSFDPNLKSLCDQLLYTRKFGLLIY